MRADFSCPPGLIGRFAIVKLWPNVKTAEDECLSRLDFAARQLGLECISVHADGRPIEGTGSRITRQDVDFVIHLHYDTPKLYDAFSFVALWNPLAFYFEWGYDRCTRNLLSHDDFLSCDSIDADDHVGRIAAHSHNHLLPQFRLYHSLFDVANPPSLGELKLFYIGINWEAIGKGKSRHQALLKRLDPTGKLRIYGPKIFQGVKVWAGYRSYVAEIPFDGKSILSELAKCGVALVLSSEAHKQSQLMSNRLFEAVAAGALVICDENPFAKKFFGDSLLYIDSRAAVDEIYDQISEHLDWAAENRDKALSMIAASQRIFRERFSFAEGLADLYRGFESRKAAIRARQFPESVALPRVRVFFLMPEFLDSVLARHISSAAAQSYAPIDFVLVVDAKLEEAARSAIALRLERACLPIQVLNIEFFSDRESLQSAPQNLGAVLNELLAHVQAADAVIFVAPNEALFSNHVEVLAAALCRNQATTVAASCVLMRNGDQPVHAVQETIDFLRFEPSEPTGLARFAFRISAIDPDFGVILPHLDAKALAALIDFETLDRSLPATVEILVAEVATRSVFDPLRENTALRDFNPEAVSDSLGPLLLPVTGAGNVKNTPASMGPRISAAAAAAMEVLSSSGETPCNEWLSVAVGGTGELLAKFDWAAAEHWGKWGLGPSQSLILPACTGSDEGDVLFYADIESLTAAKASPQQVDVLVSGVQIATWRFTNEEARGVRWALIPRDLMTSSAVVILEFRVTEARSPASLGINADERVLGIGLRRFKVCPTSVSWDVAARTAAREYPQRIEAVLDDSRTRLLEHWLPVGGGKSWSALLYKGWAKPEAGEKWGLGAEHILLLPVSGVAVGDMELLATASALVSRAYPMQTIEVFVGSRKVGTWRFFYGFTWTKKKLRISQEIIRGKDVMAIRFQPTHLRSRFMLGLGSDKQHRGLGLRAVTLKYV